ncbi:MAG: class I SAM-dependent methyltransferase [Bacteroidetes bacterium]|nr:class I SAM-dependent methyltransferase [Bacteroidota bacterium]
MRKYNWNSNLYDKKHSYVFKFGEDVVKLLAPKSNERILDLGCGTGYLTKLISQSGAKIIGIDSSEEMIKQAKQKYPTLNFEIKDATNFSFKSKLDAVFSNAVLHWIPEKEKVVSCISNALKPGGRFAAEFGGKNNVQNILRAINKILTSNGYPQNVNKVNWYFPSIGEYSMLLEKYGFDVKFASHFNRDTFLEEGVDITSWLEMFGKEFFEGIDSKKKSELQKLIVKELKPTNFLKGKWFVDYKRIRVLAVKEG